MPGEKRAQSLPQRGVVRANGGPLRSVKLDLGVVLLLMAGALLASYGVEAPPWQEVLGVLGAGSLGAAWIALRARGAARRLMTEETDGDGQG